MQFRGKPDWEASIQIQIPGKKGSRTISAPIPDVECWQCPVAAISDESFDVQQVVNDMQNMKEFSGATLYGVDSAAWDARYYDACRVISNEEARTRDISDRATS